MGATVPAGRCIRTWSGRCRWSRSGPSPAPTLVAPLPMSALGSGRARLDGRHAAATRAADPLAGRQLPPLPATCAGSFSHLACELAPTRGLRGEVSRGDRCMPLWHCVTTSTRCAAARHALPMTGLKAVGAELHRRYRGVASRPIATSAGSGALARDPRGEHPAISVSKSFVGRWCGAGGGGPVDLQVTTVALRPGTAGSGSGDDGATGRRDDDRIRPTRTTPPRSPFPRLRRACGRYCSRRRPATAGRDRRRVPVRRRRKWGRHRRVAFESYRRPTPTCSAGARPRHRPAGRRLL